jgi:type II secretory pathway pseudopilin PulG
MQSLVRSLSRQSGFTAVEFVVVVGIVAVSVALILPALQRAREAARGDQCKHNLKQLGVALHSYHDTHERFPYSTTWSTCGPSDPHVGHTWNEFLFPYFGLSALYLKLDFRVPNTDEVNAKVLANLKLPW